MIVRSICLDSLTNHSNVLNVMLRSSEASRI